MRRDAKLGLAIGGVLVAVLVVYLTVVMFRGGGEPQQQLVEEINPEAPPPSVAETPAAPAGPAAVVTQTPPAADPANTDAPAAPDAVASNAPAEPTRAQPTRTTDWNALLDGAAPLMSETPSLAPNPPAPEFAATRDDRPADTIREDAVAMVAGADAPSAPVSAARVHVVAKGETLSSISVQYYGSERFWQLIADANPGLNPNKVKIGQELAIPDVRQAVSDDARSDATAGDQPATSIDTAREYRVAPGDSLARISRKLYGDETRVTKLYEINKSTIGDNPAKLKVGMILTLPEAPAATAAR